MKTLRTETPAPAVAPTSCPFCGATTVKAASEKITESTYWRCVACGEMWNMNRMQTGPARWRQAWDRR